MLFITLVPLLSVGASIIISRQASSSLEQSQQWVKNSYITRNLINDFFDSLQDTEAAQRGYMLSEFQPYLTDFETKSLQVSEKMKGLEIHLTETPTQKQLALDMQPLVEKKIEYMRYLVDLVKKQGKGNLSNRSFTGKGKELMDTIRGKIQALQAEEDRLLSLREADFSQQIHFYTTILWGIIALSGIVTACLIYAFIRFQKLHRMVTVCAWSKSVKYKNEWLSFEEYLKRHHNLSISHGIAPEAVEKTVSSYKKSGAFNIHKKPL